MDDFWYYMIGFNYIIYLIVILIVLLADGYKKKFIFLIDVIIPFGALVRLLAKGLFYDLTKNIITAFKKLN